MGNINYTGDNTLTAIASYLKEKIDNKQGGGIKRDDAETPWGTFYLAGEDVLVGNTYTSTQPPQFYVTNQTLFDVVIKMKAKSANGRSSCQLGYGSSAYDTQAMMNRGTGREWFNTLYNSNLPTSDVEITLTIPSLKRGYVGFYASYADGVSISNITINGKPIDFSAPDVVINSVDVTGSTNSSGYLQLFSVGTNRIPLAYVGATDYTYMTIKGWSGNYWGVRVMDSNMSPKANQSATVTVYYLQQ